MQEVLKDVSHLSWKVGHDGAIHVEKYDGTEAGICKYTRGTSGAVVKNPEAEDLRLIRFMQRKDHTSPFEFASITFFIRCPIYVIRQLIRHRTAHVSEYSGRYREMIDSMDQFGPEDWRIQADSKRQASSDKIVDAITGQVLTEEQILFQKHATEVYHKRLNAGVAKELARIDLPLSNYTELYWQMDLHNLLKCLSLREDFELAGSKKGHAQQEIRDFAIYMGQAVEFLFPNVWKAFNDYHERRNALKLSAPEIKVLRQLLVNGPMSTYACKKERLMKLLVAQPEFRPQEEGEEEDYRKGERMEAFQRLDFLSNQE